MHWSKNKGPQLVDLDLATCTVFIRKAYWGKSSTLTRIAPLRKHEMSLFENFMPEVDEKADELANDGWSVMAQMRTSRKARRSVRFYSMQPGFHWCGKGFTRL